MQAPAELSLAMSLGRSQHYWTSNNGKRMQGRLP